MNIIPKIINVKEDEYRELSLVLGPLDLSLLKDRKESSIHLWLGSWGVHIWPYTYPNGKEPSGIAIVPEHDKNQGQA